MHWSCSIALAPKQSRCSVPAERFQIRRQNSPNKWTCCSQCWPIRTRSSKQLWARTDSWIISGQTRFGSIAVRLIHRRSEEHTSELQSLTNLVCRLLLEKKKKKLEI